MHKRILNEHITTELELWHYFYMKIILSIDLTFFITLLDNHNEPPGKLDSRKAINACRELM